MGSHAPALERTIAAGSRLSDDNNAALVELCRVLAAQMDAAAGAPSSRMVASYLSALKDLARASGAPAVHVPAKLAGLQAQAADRRRVQAA